MDNHYFFVGIDVSKDELVIAVGDNQVISFKNTACGVSRLVDRINSVCGDLEPWFVMESSGAYSTRPATQLVGNHDVQVSIVNPGRVKAHGKASGIRSKTDAEDAKLIHSYAIKHQDKLHPWQPTPDSFRKLKDLVDQAEFFHNQINRIRNRMHAQDFMECDRTIAKANNSVIRQIERQISKLEIQMDELVAGDEMLDTQIQLMRTIPGIAQNSARKILAMTRGMITERTPAALTAFAGLAPAQRQSGSSLNGHSYIDKQGCASLRKILYMCSLSGAEFNPALKPFYQRLITRKNNQLTKKQARVAVMRKLLLIIRAILVSGKPFNPDLHC